MNGASPAEAVAVDAPAASGSGLLRPGQRLRLLIYGGVLLTLLQFAVPYEGLIGLPVLFFLKNKLHLTAQGVAQFNLLASIPLFVGILFGFLRDVWSPFGKGDRAFLVLFGLATAAAYAIMILFKPSYGVLLTGVLLATIAIQLVWSAARGATSAVGQEQAMTGMMSVIGNLAFVVPSLAAYLLGGVLSDYLEGRGATSAARVLFGVGVGLMLIIVAMGVFGPKRLLDHHHAQERTHSVAADALRLLRHKPIYPIMVIQLLWQFGPATGAVMAFHMANDLHGTDAQVGAWYGIFLGSLGIPYLIYAWLCRRVQLGTLLWVSTVLAVGQMAPLLFAHTPTEALYAAVLLGLIGGLAQAAYTDLAIRACPPGLQGAMMMLFISGYYISLRFGDVFGAYLYERGGFSTALFVSMGVYSLILPMLLLIPRSLKAGVDLGAPAPAR